MILLIALFLFIGSGLGFVATAKVWRLQRRIADLEAVLRQFQSAPRPAGEAASAGAVPVPEQVPPEPQPEEAPAEPPAATAHEEERPEQEQPREAQPAGDQPAEGQPAEAGPSATGPTVPPATPASVHRPSTATPAASFEERLGARWTVRVGGLALVLGGIFLVRYSIEAGLLGPAARVTAGGILALVLAALGEFLRRRQAEAVANRPYIPGVLTLAATTTAFASIYSAHALYGLLGPTLAFILLAATALLTLLAAVLHGPAVASYGLVASYVVPFLVSSREPAVWSLVFYGLAVSVSAYGVARLRLWRWLAVSAALGSVFWGHVVAIAADGPWDAGALALYDVAAFAMAAFVFVVSLYPRDPRVAIERSDALAAFVLFLQSFLVLYLLQEANFSGASLALLAAIVAAMMVIASEWPAAAATAIGAFVLSALGYLSWNVPLSPRDVTMNVSEVERLAAAFGNQWADLFPTMGILLAAITGSLGLWGTMRSTGRRTLAATGVATPLAMVAIAYFRVAPYETEFLFGTICLFLALLFTGALRLIDTRLGEDEPFRETALAAYTIGAVGAIAGAMAILLGDGWLPVGLALLAAGVIWVHGIWPLRALPRVALGVVALTGLVIWHKPTIIGPLELSQQMPIFNALLYGYGVPALAFAWCAWLLRRREREGNPGLVQQTFEAIAVFAALLTASVVIHHAMNGGRFYTEPDTMAEWSLHTLVFLSAALALRRMNLRARSAVLGSFAWILGVVSLFTIGWFQLIALNPLFTGEPIGTNVLFNTLLLGYLAPAILLSFMIWETRHQSWSIYRLVAGSLVILLVFAWISLEIRAVFHRPRLTEGITDYGEFYAYSVAWLLFGVLLLLAGLRFGSRYLRLASSLFVLLAIAKVFLLDMAGLVGIWRALSFICLGAVLIGIGLLYQRLLRPATKSPWEMARERKDGSP